MPPRPPVWSPTAEDYERVFAEQNPWQSVGAVPESLALPVERPLATRLWRAVERDDPRRFQLILGPRRVGKTTCMYQTVRHLLRAGVAPRRLWWLRLDHPLLLSVPIDRLVRFALERTRTKKKGQPLFLFLDELTYAKDWDLWLKSFYDERWPVRIVGTSSSTAALRNRRLESGVGRWEEQYLAPYLLTEYLDLIGLRVELPVRRTLHDTLRAAIAEDVPLLGVEAERRRFILTGGFPELLASAPTGADARAVPRSDEEELLRSQRVLRSDAVERAIYKDIPQAFAVDNPMMLERLLYVIAEQMAGLLSPKALCARLDGLSQPTFDRYLGYLERAFLVFTVPNFSAGGAAKRGRKLYFVDGAVRNAALQRGHAPLSTQEEAGPLFENLVASHLHALAQQAQVRLCHWRDGKDEVDLVFDHPEAPLAFEVASRPAHARRGLRALIARYPRFARRCYVVSPSSPALTPEEGPDGIGSLPLDLLLLAAGRQAEAELSRRLPLGEENR